MGRSAFLCRFGFFFRAIFRFNIFILLLSSISLAGSPGELCDLIGSTHQIDKDELITCIDFATHDGDTFTVPNSVSSLSSTGLALCPLIDIDVINTDIMYVLDQSQSMPTKSVGIYTATGDTIYSNNGPQTYKGVSPGNFTILWDKGTKDVPYFIDTYLDNAGKKRPRWAGDPYGQSAIALHKTIEYQQKISPTSTAGFTGLHKFAAHKIAPKILTYSNLSALKDSIFIDDYEGRTEFYPSLLVAKNWLLDTNICKNEKQMIIFISDGAPTDPNEVDQNGNNVKKYLQLLDENHTGAQGKMPPIYGIFLGLEGASNYAPLEKLSDTTGGEFVIVPPDKPDSLVGVLKSIIESSFEAPPLEIAITNQTLMPNQTSLVDKSKLKQQVDGSWVMTLDSTIEILPGYNEFLVEINKTNSDGIKEKQIHTFTIFQDPDGTKIDTLFDERCYDMASIKLENSAPILTDTLTEKDRLCAFYFNVYRHHALSEYTLEITSLVSGDREEISFNKSDSVATSNNERLILKKGFQFHSLDTVKAISGNAIVEAVAIDTLVTTWKNPRNRKDTLSDTFYVRGEEIIYEPMQAQIIDVNEDGAADSISVRFNRNVPTLFKAEQFYWNSSDVSNKKSSADRESLNLPQNLTYSFHTRPFETQATGIDPLLSTAQLPKVVYKNDQPYKFGKREILIEDRVGAVPTSAILKRSHPLHGEFDTLEVSLSEQLKYSSSMSDYQSFLKIVAPAQVEVHEFTMYSKATSFPLASSTVHISSDSLTYQFIIKKEHHLTKGSRLFIDTASSITDKANNRASRLSVPLDDMGVLYFTRSKESTPIDSLFPVEHPHIRAHFQRLSRNNAIEICTLSVQTTDGDEEISILTETDTTSGLFTGVITTAFTKELTGRNGIVEAEYADPFTDTYSTMHATVRWKGSTISDSVTLLYKGIPYIEETKLYMQNSAGTVCNSITHLDTLLTTLLDVYTFTALEEYRIDITTATHKDIEQLLLHPGDSILGNTDTLRLIMAQKIIHFSSDITAPVKGNGTIETSANDTIFLSWFHPTDPNDKAFDTVVVFGESQSINATEAHIFDRDENGQADSISVTFDHVLPIPFPLKEAYWNSLIDSCKESLHKALQVSDYSMSYSFFTNQFPQDLTSGNTNTARCIFMPDQEYPLSSDTALLIDRVGPVPTKAMLYGASPTSSEPDTLVVTLSEVCHLTSAGSSSATLSRLSSMGKSHREMYATATPLHSTSALIDNSGLTITELLPQTSLWEYQQKWLFIDTAFVEDVEHNRASRKAVPLDYYGALFFTAETGTDAQDLYKSEKHTAIKAHLYSQSETDQIDTLILTITSSSGEHEVLQCVESSATSGYYRALLPLSYEAQLLSGNGLIEAVYTSVVTNDTTLFQAQVQVKKKSMSAQFTLTYSGKNDLYIKNSATQVTTLLSDSDSLFHLYFDTDSASTYQNFRIQIRTAEHGDIEEVTLNRISNLDPTAPTVERLLLTEMISFISSDVTRPVSQNGRVETSSNDTIFLSYSDPKAPELSVHDTVLVQGTPIVFTPMSATILDTNENGIADQLIVTYNNTLPEPFLYSALYWNSSNAVPIIGLTTVQTAITSERLTWQESTEIVTGIDPATSLEEQPKLQLTEPDFFTFSTLSVPISDAIGPVPTEAKLLCSPWNSISPDTLFVSVSELLSTTTGLSWLRSCGANQVPEPHSPISGYNSSLVVPSIGGANLSPIDTTIVALIPKNSEAVAKGSYLFLNRESTLTDVKGNSPARKRVPLKRYEKLYFSFPQNPDSAINIAEWPNEKELVATLPVESTNDLLIETVELTITLPSGDLEQFTLVETSESSGVFRVLFPFNFSASPVSNNGIVEALFHNIDTNDSDTIKAATTTVDGVFSTSVLPLVYNAPPRIVSAFYHLSGLDEITPDTLVLTTNKVVTWPEIGFPPMEELFDYWNGLSLSSDAAIAQLMKEMLQGSQRKAIILIPREYALTPGIDSIRFIPGIESIKTVEGISPQLSQYTPIRFASTPPIEVSVVPNPFYHDLSTIPELFRSYIPNAPQVGTGFRVRSRLKLRSASYSILDPLNNSIIENIPLYPDQSQNRLYGSWSGENSSGRKVGDGAYMVLFVIEDVLGNHYERSTLVGVKEYYIPKYTFPWDD